MTKEEAIVKLREAQEMEDIEIAHSYADGVLCELLKTLGCEEVVEEWDKLEKWYA